MPEYKTTVLNVFVNGDLVSPDLYTVTDDGRIEFVKPLRELFPLSTINVDKLELAPDQVMDGEPGAAYWVVVEMEYV